MAYKFQLGAARLSGSLIQEGDITADSSDVTAVNGEFTTQISAAAAQIPQDGLTYGGTAITATAAEMNYLDNDDLTSADIQKLADITADASELNIMEGVTATTAELNYLAGADEDIKTLSLPANTTISTFAKSFLDDADEATFKATVNLEIGVDVQAWDAELDTLSGMTSAAATAAAALSDVEYAFLDGAVAGTVVASKAIVVDGNKDFSTVRSGSFEYIAASNMMSASLMAAGEITTDGSFSAGGIALADASGLAGAALVDNGGVLDVAVDTRSFRISGDQIQLDAGIAGSGIILNSGSLDVDLGEINTGTVAVSEDNYLFIDATDGSTKRASLSDYAVAIAGDALLATNGALDVKVDTASFAIVSDAVALASGVAGDALSLNSGVLNVRVDDSTIEVNADVLRVPTSGISNLQLSGNIAADKLQLGNALFDDAGALKMSASVAGDGIGYASEVLSVNVDGTTIEINADTLRVPTSGISNLQLSGNIAADKLQLGDALYDDAGALRMSASVAGDGIGYASEVLSVNVDDSSIEISADAIQVKALGITNDMLAGSIANAKLVNDSITLNQGAGMAAIGTVALGGNITVAVDGVLEDLDALGAPTTDGQFIVATGAGSFAYESANTARTSLGLGTGDSPQFTDLTLSGDLIVQGTTTTIQSTTVEIADLNILLASGSISAAVADGAGLTVDGADVQWKYSDSNDAGTISEDFWIASGSAGLISIEAKEFHGNFVGSVTYAVKNHTSSGTLENGVNTSKGYSGNITLSLPSSPVSGDSVKVKGSSNTSNSAAITIGGNGNNVDGVASIVLESPYAAVECIFDGSEWFVF